MMQWTRSLTLNASILVASLNAAQWNVGEPRIISTDYTTIAFASSFDPTTGTFLAVGAGSLLLETISSKPFYTLYDPSTQTWGKPELIAPSSPSETGYIYITYLPTTGQFLAVWADFYNNDLPTYAVYTPDKASSGSWSSPETISQEPITGNLIYLSLNAEGKILATCKDKESKNPIYAYYTPDADGSGSWGEIGFISNTSITGDLVISSYDSITGETIAVWQDPETLAPAYSIYSSGINEWSTPLIISQDSQPAKEIFVAFDSRTGQTLSIWQDNNTHLPTYSFYSPGSGWGPIGTIPLGSSQAGALNLIMPLFDPISGQFLAIWTDKTTNVVCYSIYTPGSGWAISTQIPNATNYKAISAVLLAFDSQKGQALATWGGDNEGASYPTYAIFQGPKPRKWFDKHFFRSGRLY